MDPNYQTVATVRAGNGYAADLHDFQIAPHNVAYISVYNVMRCDLSSLGGVRNGVIIDTAVQQVDIKTGLVRWEWHSLDHASVSESHAPVPTTAIPWDFFHLNSIDVEPGGDLLLSARSTWAAYQLQAGSGTIVWRLGGTNSSFAMGPGPSPAWQPDPRLLPDGRGTMFSAAPTPKTPHRPRARPLPPAPTRRTARLIAAYPHPGGQLLSDSQGNM